MLEIKIEKVANGYIVMNKDDNLVLHKWVVTTDHDFCEGILDLIKNTFKIKEVRCGK